MGLLPPTPSRRRALATAMASGPCTLQAGHGAALSRLPGDPPGGDRARGLPRVYDAIVNFFPTRRGVTPP